ncbi:MAG: amidohydrolase, partial [Sedimentibacter sp.]|nr:amidohydrolase [Sedimentibacter sp.]
NEADRLKTIFFETSDYIYNNPELGNNENKSSEKLINLLMEHGFSVEKGIVGRSTAFKAVFDSKKPGPTVAYLCEYDALPEIGHGCGHNIIGTSSAAAGILLSKVINSTGGKVYVIGTPAEETDGAKVEMVNKGVFNDIDISLMFHPFDKTHESGESLAMDALEFTYIGKSAHAAADPEKGINALDGVLQLFSGINALRQHVKSDVRIHGIIKEGGIVPNVVPDKAVARFYVRAKERAYLNEVVKKIKDIAHGAALITGSSVNIVNYEASYDNLVTNQNLSKVFSKNLRDVGVPEIHEPRKSFGSIDMGNVSHVTPAIHPYLSIGSRSLTAHSKEMADATITNEAHEMMLKGIMALALTGYDILADEELYKSIKYEFDEHKAAK